MSWDDPIVSYGLTGIVDWSTEMPFLDIRRMMRPPLGVKGSDWNYMPHEDLDAAGYLDADGYPTSIPPDVDSVSVMWAWTASNTTTPAAASRKGEYTFTYDGEGTFTMPSVNIISSEPGRVVFENPTGNTMGINIVTTDPSGTGDYMRNFSIVREDYQPLVDAGEIFTPGFLAAVENARELRFMSWMRVDFLTFVDWADRPHVSDAGYRRGGVPVEIMVALCNQTGTDPWFCMPHTASDDYVTQFATYVRDNLNPGLVAHVELSNEVWNWNVYYNVCAWFRDQALAEWGEGDNLDYYVKRITEMAVIWKGVFGAEADTRLDAVLAIHTGSAWNTQRMLDSAVWQAHDQTGFVAPATVLDSIAQTSYFGTGVILNETQRSEFLTLARDSSVDIYAWLTAKMMDQSYASSIPNTVAAWLDVKAVADANGLKMTLYEGGQHILHSAGVSGLSDADLALLTEVLSGYIRSPEMATLYEALLDAWAEVGDGPFMQLSDVGAPTEYGAWGIYSALGDDNPRAKHLRELNETRPSWFGTGGGSQYAPKVCAILKAGETKREYGRGGLILGETGTVVLLDGEPEDYSKARDAVDPSIYTLTNAAGGALELRGVTFIRAA